MTSKNPTRLPEPLTVSERPTVLVRLVGDPEPWRSRTPFSLWVVDRLRHAALMQIAGADLIREFERESWLNPGRDYEEIARKMNIPREPGTGWLWLDRWIVDPHLCLLATWERL